MLGDLQEKDENGDGAGRVGTGLRVGPNGPN